MSAKQLLDYRPTGSPLKMLLNRCSDEADAGHLLA